MIHHIVLLRLVPDVTQEALEPLVTTLSNLAAGLDGIEDYRVGRDLGLRANNDDLAIVARFRDRQALDHYLTHPEHLAALAKYGPELVTEKHSVQFQDDSAPVEASPTGSA